MSKITLTPLGLSPVLRISMTEFAARIASDLSGTTTSYELMIVAGSVVPIPVKSYDVGMGTDIGASLKAIAAALPYDLPGLYASYAEGVLSIQDYRRVYTALGVTDLHAKFYRNYPPANAEVIGDWIYATLEELIPANAHTKLIYNPAVSGPWAAAPDVAVLAPPVVETLPTGWDQMRERLLAPYSPFFAPGTRREHALDDRALPFATMLSQEERVVGFFGPWPIIELTSQGFAREKPWIIQTTGDYQGEVGSVSGVARNYPTVTVTWFSDSLQQTKTVIPLPAVPPETFGWQALSITSGLSNNEGWILVKRDVDPLPVITGSSAVPETNAGNVTRASANLHPRPTLCKVVDYYVYDPENTLPPND